MIPILQIVHSNREKKNAQTTRNDTKKKETEKQEKQQKEKEISNHFSNSKTTKEKVV